MSIEGLVSSLVFPFENCKCVPSGSPDDLTTIMYIAQINKCIHLSDAVATRFSRKYPSFADDVNVINRGAPYTGFECVKVTSGPGEPGRAEAVDFLLSESRRILKPSIGPTSQLLPISNLSVMSAPTSFKLNTGATIPAVGLGTFGHIMHAQPHLLMSISRHLAGQSRRSPPSRRPCSQGWLQTH